MKQGTPLYDMFHDLWSNSVGNDGYVRADWIKFEQLINDEISEPLMTVLQPWLEKIPIRMQSTLILGLRGPDSSTASPHLKTICRWLRGVAFKPGNPANAKEFMTGEPEEIFEKGPVAKELEFCTQHYYSHLMHALEVVAYCHPTAPIASCAFRKYEAMCHLMHLPLEGILAFQERLKMIEWPGGKQPLTFEDVP